MPMQKDLIKIVSNPVRLSSRTKKLEVELSQVRAQLERTSSANFDEMLSFQKFASDNTTVFVSPANNVNAENNECKTEIASENVDKGKSILGVPPKLKKKETRNPRTKKVNNKKSQLKKLHLCHHYGASGHTRPNCYKWLAT